MKSDLKYILTYNFCIDVSRLQSMEDGLSQDALDYRFQTTEQSEVIITTLPLL